MKSLVMKYDGSVDMKQAEYHNLTPDNLREMGFQPKQINIAKYQKFIEEKRKENETLIKNNPDVYKILKGYGKYEDRTIL